MRYFPSASRPRLLAASLACALGVGALAVPFAQAADGDDLKDKQKQVEKQIDHAHEDLEHSSKQVRQATARLESAQAKLADARDAYAVTRAKLTAAQARDAELRTKLAEAEARLTEARADLAAGEQAVADQRASFVARVTDLYTQGDPRLYGLVSILDAQDPSDLLRRLQANDTMMGKEDATYDALRSAQVLEVHETQVQDAQEAVAEQQAAAAAHVTTMQTLTADAAAAKQQVEGLVATARSARADAWAAQRHDREILQQLQAREDRIKRQIQAAAERAARRGGGYTGESDGFLSSPVPGAPITSPFGYREHPIYHYWGLHDGTDFGAGCGTPLRAVASGTVMQEYWSSVYGNRLYLNVGRANGQFLTAVYNHATRYTVSVGEHVDRGEIIGYVGSTGWSTGCHLHFTVLANGNAVNPMNWL